jgi:hypothetical protein
MATRAESTPRYIGREIREEDEHRLRGSDVHSTLWKTSNLASMTASCQRPKVEGGGNRA